MKASSLQLLLVRRLLLLFSCAVAGCFEPPVPDDELGSPTGPVTVMDTLYFRVDWLRTGGIAGTARMTVRPGNHVCTSVSPTEGKGCKAAFPRGSQVSITAHALAGARFGGWSAFTAQPSQCTGSSPVCTVVMRGLNRIDGDRGEYAIALFYPVQ